MPKLMLVAFDPSISYKGLKTFDCGNEMINAFVHKSLKKRVKRNFSQAYVLLDEKERFVGFYTLDTFAIARELFDESNKPAGTPPMLPVIKLGMLGVSKSSQHQGIGQRLLKDAILKVHTISKIAGCAGLYLLAEERAVCFYDRLGFIALKDTVPTPMFLDIGVIRSLLDEAS